MAAVMDVVSLCAQPSEVTRDLLVALEPVVRCTFVFWESFRLGEDPLARLLVAGEGHPGEMPIEPWFDHLPEHPILSRRHGDVVSFSDVTTPERRVGTWLWEHEGDDKTLDELGVHLSPRGPERSVVSFCRLEGPEFDARDHDVLALLRPHLAGALSRHGEQQPSLTRRQTEILRLVRDGCTDRRIARDLGCAEATVGKHLEAAYVRLGARNRAHAVVLAGNALDDPPA